MSRTRAADSDTTAARRLVYAELRAAEASTAAEFQRFDSAGAAGRAEQELRDAALVANIARGEAGWAGGAASDAVSRPRGLRRELCLNSRHLKRIPARGFVPSPFSQPMAARRRYDLPASSHLDLFCAALVSCNLGEVEGQIITIRFNNKESLDAFYEGSYSAHFSRAGSAICSHPNVQ